MATLPPLAATRLGGLRGSVVDYIRKPLDSTYSASNRPVLFGLQHDGRWGPFSLASAGSVST